ncbi:carbohydrate ABC transporter permease [Ruminiclostridium cellobioparum]|uniref:carbohydrate ABC transporter permease n=1 Tax=Ruminiclostridium cellobioparum TaxID=29355 RepID=UPI000485B79A|nr:carbohydrate ABC transporter permease [Ruminiclostridium cellobioparum]
MKKNTLLGRIVPEILLSAFGLLFMYPVILMVINSIKPFREVVMDVIALPGKIEYQNYLYVIKYINYPRLFLNNFLITALGIGGIVLFSSMAGYMLSRHKNGFTRFAYLFCIVPMLIPFQTIMITLLKVSKTLGLSESIPGLGIQYWGFGIPMAVFIYSGFVGTIPREIDESALIDGASTAGTFFKIIFPLLRSITATVIALDVMWIWNDFLLPLLMVNGSVKTKTLTLAAYTFVGQYNTQWHYTMTAMVLAVFPSILFFIFMQKYIIKGVVSGAVKG